MQRRLLDLKRSFRAVAREPSAPEQLHLWLGSDCSELLISFDYVRVLLLRRKCGLQTDLTVLCCPCLSCPKEQREHYWIKTGTSASLHGLQLPFQPRLGGLESVAEADGLIRARDFDSGMSISISILILVY